MIPTPDAQKRYRTARERLVRYALNRFFALEFPRLFGPLLRQKVVDELLRIFSTLHRDVEHVRPGQCLWLALDARTRGDHPQRRLKPVILTLFNEADAESLSSGVAMTQVRSEAIARVMREAHQQGALLSMRDIELLTWRRSGSHTNDRQRYEKANDCVLPHTGTLQDMGSCVTHKRQIVIKAIGQSLDPLEVARQTNHTLAAVERYVNDYQRVVACLAHSRDVVYISKVTKIAPFVVRQYLEIHKELNPS